MAKICFVSYEIHPTVMGGCGVLLHQSARVLLSQGHEVLFLLDVDDKSFQQFNQVDRLCLPNAQNCRAYLVSTLVQGQGISPHTFISFYEFKAYQFFQAARKLYDMEHPDVIEFFEYCGAAYYALSAKIAGLDFINTHLAVRLHSPMEQIDRQQPGLIHGIDRYVMYGLEHQAMRLAETVLYPSKAYLEKGCLEYYEPWFGNKVHSEPAIIDYPVPAGASDQPDVILFYGRLRGSKGVDPFVDAAVLYLSNPQNPRRSFYLVGVDSNLPPTGQGSYREYLLGKIPPSFRDAFIFTGQISWQRLGELLPHTLFAVIPTYLETFGYAARELYEAGIPMIVTDIPAFADSFHHNINALVFDGTVGDLAEKMRLLSTDETLRRKISRPFSIVTQPLGDFYNQIPTQTWIKTDAPTQLPRLLVCILVDDPNGLENTLRSLQAVELDHMRIILMRPAPKETSADGGPTEAAVWFMGKLYIPQDRDGNPINPTEVHTDEALLILKAGDLLETDYLPRSLAILQRQPQIAYIGSWKYIQRKADVQLAALPLDAVLEIAPFIQSSPFSRFVMRSRPGRLLIDLFDPRAGRLGELAYLWGLETGGLSGLIMPLPWVTHLDDAEPILDQPSLDYIILQDDNPFRKTRLARFSLSLANRKHVLRRFQFELDLGDPSVYKLRMAQYQLASSRLSKWMSRFPRLKKVATVVVNRTVNTFSWMISATKRKQI